ncbi:MAG: hypothetical protein KH297_04690 [Firmicutes bacterium]|nr:hypothetical protein [Bacillota bacterium]
MARTTTESIESKNKISEHFDVFDLFFVSVYMAVSLIFKSMVNNRLGTAFMVFSALIAGFLTMRSSFNKKRRNYESIFFLLQKDMKVYRPFYRK